MGDHVKVLAGRYEGDTGLIVRVEENRVVLFSDLTMHELEVLPRDLQLCSDMATGVDSLGQFQWGDLVALEYAHFSHQLDPEVSIGTLWIGNFDKEPNPVLEILNHSLLPAKLGTIYVHGFIEERILSNLNSNSGTTRKL